MAVSVRTQDIAPKTNHPTTWLPKGKPSLACKEATLDLVTTIASRMSPIYEPLISKSNPNHGLTHTHLNTDYYPRETSLAGRRKCSVGGLGLRDDCLLE